MSKKVFEYHSSKENTPSPYKAAVYVLYVDNLASNNKNGFYLANHLCE